MMNTTTKERMACYCNQCFSTKDEPSLSKFLVHIIHYIWRWDCLVKHVQITREVARLFRLTDDETERLIGVPAFQPGLDFLSCPVLLVVTILPAGMLMKATADPIDFEYPVFNYIEETKVPEAK